MPDKATNSHTSRPGGDIVREIVEPSIGGALTDVVEKHLASVTPEKQAEYQDIIVNLLTPYPGTEVTFCTEYQWLDGSTGAWTWMAEEQLYLDDRQPFFHTRAEAVSDAYENFAVAPPAVNVSEWRSVGEDLAGSLEDIGAVVLRDVKGLTGPVWGRTNINIAPEDELALRLVKELALKSGRHQEENREREFRVVWEVDVSAATPEEAAQKAREMQLKLDTEATVFNVRSGGVHTDFSESVEVDLYLEQDHEPNDDLDSGPGM